MTSIIFNFHNRKTTTLRHGIMPKIIFCFIFLLFLIFRKEYKLLLQFVVQKFSHGNTFEIMGPGFSFSGISIDFSTLFSVNIDWFLVEQLNVGLWFSNTYEITAVRMRDKYKLYKLFSFLIRMMIRVSWTGIKKLEGLEGG